MKALIISDGGSKGAFAGGVAEYLFRTFKFMNYQNSSKDIIIGKLIGLNKKVNINFYYTPTQLTDNPLIFNPEQMKQWLRICQI